jgi:hypothetical protein
MRPHALRFWVAATLAAAALPLHAQPTDNPVATFYNGPEGHPAWTDDIRWDQVFDVTAFGGGTGMNGTQNFSAFEAARDAAFAAGGGVVYFPAGNYSITLLDAGQGPGVGPNSRGLMLRNGTVLRGATPTGDRWARPYGNYTADGNLMLSTRLVFDARTRADYNGTNTTIPTDWSIIGLKRESGQGIKDVDNVGVVWIELQRATIYWGADYEWTSTWNASSGFLGGRTKQNWPDVATPWSARVADGTHPGDTFCGATANFTGSGAGRLVFGCRLVDAVPVNDFYYASGRGANAVASAFGVYRFCGRVAAYGSDVFIANNVLPKSANNFFYRQWTRDKDNNVAARDVLWDYTNSIGIDVNKSLHGVGKPALLGSGYYETGVVIRDNFVFSRGNKGFDASGQWAVIENNHNERYYLGATMPPDYPRNGTSQTVNSDSWYCQTPANGESAYDYLSRGYDLGGRNLWVDRCTVNNTGSAGNDGEGVMSQRLNNIDIYSWAFTDNRQYNVNNGSGTSGELGWIGGYGQNIYGFLLLRNINDNTVGHLGPGDWWMLDMTAGGNLKNSGLAASLSANLSANSTRQPRDFNSSNHTNAVSPPANLTVSPLGDFKGIQIDWADTASNELGFRVERRINEGAWQIIAYRPAINQSKNVAITGNDSFSPTPINQLNNPRWVDYTAPRERRLEYRVFAINGNDDDSFVTSISPPVGVAGPALTFEQWIARFSTGGLNGPLDDPEHDGSTNLVEFGQSGNDPVASDTQLLPEAALIGDQLVFTYVRRPSANGIVVKPQYTAGAPGADDPGWTDAVHGVNGVSISTAGDQVTVSIPASLAKFARLQIVK